MTWIKNNFLTFVVLILVIILFLQRTNSGKSVQQSPDTAITNNYYTVKGDTTIVKPTVREIVKEKIIVDSSLYAKSDSQLIKIIQDLKEELLAKKLYSDTFPVDTIGSIVIDQEVSGNSIQKQTLQWDIQIPEKTITITKPINPKNLWMVGGSLGGNKQDLINQINADLLLITKKQKGYSIGTGIDMNGRVNYRFGLYWKL